ncbi:hypothetical protein EVAR_21029_1 [Eumeta japonica]|uniref:Uncharacterized protein n=1 Tax=Eumeta variegata TaxID=151549 RepID=A0A4C1V136_EUMVA|nr:hypothetical protein EVAR_21029_1 [Eumeta japonica]
MEYLEFTFRKLEAPKRMITPPSTRREQLPKKAIGKLILSGVSNDRRARWRHFIKLILCECAAWAIRNRTTCSGVIRLASRTKTESFNIEVFIISLQSKVLLMACMQKRRQLGGSKTFTFKLEDMRFYLAHGRSDRWVLAQVKLFAAYRDQVKTSAADFVALHQRQTPEPKI